MHEQARTIKSSLWVVAAMLAVWQWSAVAAEGRPATSVLGHDAARHLLVRTSFAATAADVSAYAQLTREEAADRLISAARAARAGPAPDWTAQPFQSARGLSVEERRLLQQDRYLKGIELRSWWLEQMLATPAPLAEKMTLLWHNHFVSSQQKVRSPQLMYRQNVLLRDHALGNFGELLHAVARDPAMVIYLDSASNRKGQPNENFAREVMELFTLGEGHYSEADVKEAARAFTGWSVDPDTGSFVFRRPQHDDGTKTILGRTGEFDGDAVLDILLGQPETAEHVVAKLWREFVSPVPDAAEVRRIAGVFRDSNYEVSPVLKALLASDAFYAPENRASLIKSPVDLVVGTLRQFRFTLGEPLPFVFTLNRLGQNLFAPPNVKGWPGGTAWINSTTLLARKQFLERLFREDDANTMRPALDRVAAVPRAAEGLDGGRDRVLRAMADIRFDAPQWLSQFPRGDAPAIQHLILAGAPANPAATDAQGMAAVRLLTQDPAYQLK